MELDKDSAAEEVSLADEVSLDKLIVAGKPNPQNYVSQSAAALRCRAMPPPCYRNPYLKDVSQKETDPFANQRSKCAGIILVNLLLILSLNSGKVILTSMISVEILFISISIFLTVYWYKFRVLP